MELQSNSLSFSKRKPLQEWLSHQQADVFVSVIESRIFKLELEAAADVSASNTGGMSREAMIERAQSKAADIECHRQLIKILREVRDAETLKTYTATPTRTQL